MKKENIIKTIVSSLGYLALFFVVAILIGLGVQLFCYFIYSELRLVDYEAYTGQLQTFIEANTTYIGLIQFVFFLVILFLIFGIKRKSLLKYVRWNPVSKQVYALVTALAISSIVAVNFLTEFLMPQSWLQGAEEYSDAVMSGGLFLNFIVIVLIGPFTEELLYRGLMAGRLLGRLPLWLVVFIPVILFGVSHGTGGMGQVTATAMVGLVFTLVFIWTNSLRTAVLAHMLNNLCAAFIPWSLMINGMNKTVQIMLGVVGCAATVFLAYMLYKRRKREN